MTDKFPFLDFFAGSGLVTEALKASFKAVWANDICEKKRRVYSANHSTDHLHGGGVEEYSGQTLPEAILSWASFPCQDLSLAGSLKGINASRSGLVWHWLRTIDEMKEAGKQPPIVVAENVIGLLSGQGGAHYRELHEALTQRGYKVGPVVLDASHWVPQSRPRVFVVGVPEKLNIKGLWCEKPSWTHAPALMKAINGLSNLVLWKLPQPSKRKLHLSDIIEYDAPCDQRGKARHNLNLIPEKHKKRLFEASRKGLKVAPGYKRIRNRRQVLELRFDDTAGCLRTPQGGSSRQFLVIPRENKTDTRLLTIREAARLMGADNYKLPGVLDGMSIPGSYNDGYKAMGDAVAVPAVDYLSSHILTKVAERICSTG